MKLRDKYIDKFLVKPKSKWETEWALLRSRKHTLYKNIELNLLTTCNDRVSRSFVFSAN